MASSIHDQRACSARAAFEAAEVRLSSGPGACSRDAAAPSGKSYLPFDHRAVAAVFAASCLAGSAVLCGQQQPQRPAKMRPDDFRVQVQQVLLDASEQDGYRWDQAPMLIESSAALANLIDRGAEATGRGDWKLAIDSLQRVIEDSEGSLLPRSQGAKDGGVLFESARRHARRQLGALPEEGLRAYRMIYDGKARGMVDRARATHDESALRSVVDKYLLTSVGDEAADLLASWLLDEGRAGEALAVLLELVEFSPDRDVPQNRVSAKLAAAFALLGRAADARSVLDKLGAESGAADSMDWISELSVVDPNAHAGDFGGGRLLSADAVAPALLEATPWRYDLPGGMDGAWRKLFEEDASGPPQIGLAELATDGERVFVRKRGGCSALWPDDLSTVWEASLTSDQEIVTRNRTAEMQMILARRAPSTILEDDASKLISTAAGLVFVIETGGMGEYAGNDDVAAVGAPPAGPQRSPPAPQPAVGTTRLVAVDARTGETRWQRGRTGQPADLLGTVQFASVPILVNGSLWVPFFQTKDFYIAVLDPANGRLLRSVLLGSVQQLGSTRRWATPLGQGHGVVYVPSGYGTLFALDAIDFSLRWAAQYDRTAGGGVRVAQNNSPWMPSAPVAAGGLVLMAATDYPALLAFSAADGRFAWSLQAQDSTYILAVRPDRIWLGGRGVACHSVLDGTLIWQAQLGAVPTGRGVLTGERILLPSSDGLTEFVAESGEIMGKQELGPGQMPLGNLLCLDPAVFSLDSISVRRYPDIDRSKALALSRFEANPGDARAATQLAWAELLSGNAPIAVEITSDFAKSMTSTDLISEAFRRVRIESLLTSARQSTDEEAALGLLQSADEAARTPEQTVRVRLAVADQLAAMDRPLEAHRTLFALGLEADAERTVANADAVEFSSRFDIARRLEQLRPSLTAPELTEVDDEIAIRVDKSGERLAAGDSAALHELRVIADLNPTRSAGKRALFVLAENEVRRQRFESAEQFLRECMRRDGDANLTIAANMKLCEMYTANVQGSSSMLGPCLDDLEASFGAQPIPAGPFGGEPGSSGLVREWVSRQRAALPAVANDSPSEPVQLTGERLWSFGFESGSMSSRLVDFDNRVPPALRDAVLVFTNTDDTLECLRAGGGGDPDAGPTLLWRTELRLPGSFVGNRTTAVRELLQPRRAVVDGQIAVFNASDGLFAVGLVTGRRLWVRPYDAPLESDLVPDRDALMAAADGYVAAMPSAGRLSLLRAVDGSTVWERDLRGEPVMYIWLEGDRVLTADASLQRLHIFDRADGRLVNLVLFRQPDIDAGFVRLVRAGGVVCGPDSSSRAEALTAIRLQDGQAAWRIEIDKPIGQLFVPDRDKIGVGLIGGDVRIIDAPTGNVILERHFSRGLPITDAVLVDGTLFAQAERRHGQLRVPELVAIDVATGEEVWMSSDLAAMQEPPGLLAVHGGTIAAMIDASRTQVKAAGAPVQQFVIGLSMIDMKTGKPSGTVVDLPAPNSGVRINRDMAIRPGVIIVGSNRALQAYSLSPPPSDQGAGF